MKIAYFDAPTGLSGNMILASLLDAGLSLAYLKKELKKLGIAGYDIVLKKVIRQNIGAKYLDVSISEKEPRRSINDIYRIISKSRLKSKIKEMSLKIFKRLYGAECGAHGKRIGHLHETGATDAIVDIVGTVIGLDKLGIEEIYCSSLPMGHGTIRHAHGRLPNPAPATAQLLKGVPVYKKQIRAELVTPTGAAIMTTLAKKFDIMPKLELKSVGSGAGTFDLSEPNVLRIFIGNADVSFNEDVVCLLETNIDNMNPELYDHVIKRLMSSGALDAYITPILMKKNRPSVKLSVISSIGNRQRLLDMMFRETTTLGVRTYLVKREKLDRDVVAKKTSYGTIRLKVGRRGGRIYNVAPEYEDCVKASIRTNIPLKNVIDKARAG